MDVCVFKCVFFVVVVLLKFVGKKMLGLVNLKEFRCLIVCLGGWCRSFLALMCFYFDGFYLCGANEFSGFWKYWVGNW